MTEMNLKPCPFCGGKPDLGSYSSSGNWIVVCSKCEAETQVYETEQEVIKAWNNRQVKDDEIKYEPTSYSCKACKNATENEIKRLREALEEIQDAITLLNTTDVLEHISDRISQALKRKEE